MDKENIKIYRAFIAYTLPEEINRYCQLKQKELKASKLRGSWTRPENFHITILFLGDRSGEELEIISEFISVQKIEMPDIKFKTDSISTFGRPPKVLYLGLKNPDGKAISAAEMIINRFGKGKDVDQGWTSHITLARIKSGRSSDIPEVQEEQIIFSPESITLFTSRLTENGPVYLPYSNCQIKQ